MGSGRRHCEPADHRSAGFSALLFAALTLVLLSVPTPGLGARRADLDDARRGRGAGAAPSSVEFVFDEPVFLVPDGFQLYDGSGGHRTMQAEAAGATVRVALPSQLADGSYVLGWRVISDDSHPESGVLSFVVGHAGASVPTVAESDARPVDVLYGVLTGLRLRGVVRPRRSHRLRPVRDPCHHLASSAAPDRRPPSPWVPISCWCPSPRCGSGAQVLVRCSIRRSSSRAGPRAPPQPFFSPRPEWH